MSPESSHGPFVDVRVLDLTTSLAGATAGALLADYGADVVRVEEAELSGTPSPEYVAGHRGKRIAVLPGAHTAENGELRRLIGAADVLLLDGPSSALRDRGLDAESVAAWAPGLIHVSMPGVLETGEWSDLPSDELLLTALSGVSDYHKATEDRPVALVVPLLSYTQGGLAATAVAAALYERLERPVGRPVVVTGLHAVAAMQAAVMVDAPGILHMYSGGKGQGDTGPNFTTYQCADGQWLYLGALVAPFFLQALDVLDAMDVMVMPEVEGDFARVMLPAAAKLVNRRLQQAFSTRPRAEWLRLLEEAEVPVAPVLDREEWFESETIIANHMRTTLEDPVLGEVVVPSPPVVLPASPGRVQHLPGRAVCRPSGDYWTTPSPVPWARAAGGAAGDASYETPGALPMPLADLRVLDGASFMAAPFAATLLGGFGAEVTKVEGPEGDPYRFYPAAYAAVNRGKGSTIVDLKEPAGRARLVELLGSADVYLDNLRPQVRARLGLDEATLRAANPDAILASMTAFGEGPLRAHPGFDPLLQARSGMLSVQGGDDAPVMSTMSVNDIGAGTLLGFGIVGALFHRRRTGVAQQVATSLANASVWLQNVEVTAYAGRPAPQRGGRDFPGPEPFHRLYECRDGWIALAALDDAAQQRTSTALGLGAGDSAQAGPGSAAGELGERLAAVLGTQPRGEALHRLQEAQVPAVPVLSRHDVYSDPWLLGSGFYRTVEEPQLGTCTVVREFVRWPGVGWDGPDRVWVLGESDADADARRSRC